MISNTLRSLLKIGGTGEASGALNSTASNGAASVGLPGCPTDAGCAPLSHEAGISALHPFPRAGGAVGQTQETVGRLEPANGGAAEALSHLTHLSHPEERTPANDVPSFWERVALVRRDHEHFINHLMRCPHCYAPKDRYCTEGTRRQELLRMAWEAN